MQRQPASNYICGNNRHCRNRQAESEKNMDIEQVRAYCLSKPLSEESFPFDDVTLVFKTGGKMFAVVSLEKPDGVTLKCDPDLAEDYRSRYRAVTPAWHFNKRYWNTVEFGSDVGDRNILEMIDHSYAEVVRKLPRRLRIQYEPTPNRQEE